MAEAIRILREERDFVVCVKPAGVLSEEPGMPARVREQLGGELYCVHRLDRAVGGVMVYARTSDAAAKLSRAVADRTMNKEYLAVCRGIPEPDRGILEDLLFKDSGKQKAFVVQRERKGVKPARLAYQTRETIETPAGPVTLLQVRLETGRFHQIRVQFASRQHPLLGDRKYGGPGDCGIALWSYRLTFPHPRTGAMVEGTAFPPEIPPWTWFSGIREGLMERKERFFCEEPVDFMHLK